MNDDDVGRPIVGHHPTFDALFLTEYPKMVALAAAVSGRRDHAEEVAQDALAIGGTRSVATTDLHRARQTLRETLDEETLR